MKQSHKENLPNLILIDGYPYSGTMYDAIQKLSPENYPLRKDLNKYLRDHGSGLTYGEMKREDYPTWTGYNPDAPCRPISFKKLQTMRDIIK